MSYADFGLDRLRSSVSLSHRQTSSRRNSIETWPWNAVPSHPTHMLPESQRTASCSPMLLTCLMNLDALTISSGAIMALGNSSIGGVGVWGGSTLPNA